jgi:hypothetical protein
LDKGRGTVDKTERAKIGVGADELGAVGSLDGVLLSKPNPPE